MDVKIGGLSEPMINRVILTIKDSAGEGYLTENYDGQRGLIFVNLIDFDMVYG